MGYVSNLQAFTAPFFLISRKWLQPLLSKRTPLKRPMDNVILDPGMPQEEEVALANASHLSIFHALSYPDRTQAIWDKVGTMALDPLEMAQWEHTYLDTLRKATIAFGGRRLVLKTPANMGRTALLRRLFPQACFVAILRDPYTIYPSLVNFYRKLIPSCQIRDAEWSAIEQWIVDTFVTLMQTYLRDRETIPPEKLIEIRFETLERTPLETAEAIYEKLDLPGWTQARRPIQRYLKSITRYEKNRYRMDDATLDKITRAWGDIARTLGYTPPRRP